jgi:hypothetical protein
MSCTSIGCEEDYDIDLFLPPPPLPSFVLQELGISEDDNDSSLMSNGDGQYCHLCKWADPSIQDNWSFGGSAVTGQSLCDYIFPVAFVEKKYL